MRLAAISGGSAIAIWLWANFMQPDGSTPQVRIAAQLQLIHAMTCFASATFMNLGAVKARFAPPCFLSGSLLLCGSLYASGLAATPLTNAVGTLGAVMLLAGWSILIFVSHAIDRHRVE